MARNKSDQTRRLVNRRASLEYHILEKLEAGISLKGTEVKSLRAGMAKLEESYARIDPQGVVLLNFQIEPYPFATGTYNHAPKRPKRLLMRKREIRKLTNKVTLKGQTLIPLSVYFNEKGLAKVELALAKGKSRADKRQDLKARDAKREMDRAMRRGR